MVVGLELTLKRFSICSLKVESLLFCEDLYELYLKTEVSILYSKKATKDVLRDNQDYIQTMDKFFSES